MAQTAAFANISVLNNGDLTDAFVFGVSGDTTWSFTGATFKMEVKASAEDSAPLLTLVSPTTIVVDDVVQRVLHLNVAEAALNAALPVGTYVYDLVMTLSGVRTPLMQGQLYVCQGVTMD